MMPTLGDTIAALVRQRRHIQEAGAPTSQAQPSRTAPQAALVKTSDFGPNPGNLQMLSYRPNGLSRPAPLVVVLHGCTQTAAAYADGAGWLALARRFGFALLCPEQKAINNLNRCFNWFQIGDAARGRGEAASIRAMIAHVLAEEDLDPARVFVVGLSAGGAMTSVMLACYPEVFAGGAVIAGLPYGAAVNLQDAFAAMVHGVVRTGPDWGERVRAASDYAGPWPKVSIWQGEADTTVNPLNADEIAKQWRDVHGLASAAPQVETGAGHRRSVWADRRGEPVIEAVRIAGLAHGAPLATAGPDGYGAAGPFLLEAGISSSLEIARFWGLTEGRAAGAPSSPVRPSVSEADTPALARPGRTRRGVRGAIIKALTAVGLMK
jgi:poly(hydroxyalkanoate) depolymerase family esterase